MQRNVRIRLLAGLGLAAFLAVSPSMAHATIAHRVVRRSSASSAQAASQPTSIPPVSSETPLAPSTTLSTNPVTTELDLVAAAEPVPPGIGNAMRPASTRTVHVVSGNVDRTAIVHVPPSKEGTLLPLVIALHGSSGSADEFETITGLDQTADTDGFIVVYPNGELLPDDTTMTRSWNSGGCCTPATTFDVNDVSFLNDLLDVLPSLAPFNSERVIIAGHSNGAIMAQRFACEATDRIYAVVSISGALDSDLPCSPTRPVSMMEVHGTNDTNIDYANAVDDTSFWAKADHCNTFVTTAIAAIIKQAWSSCSDGTSVTFITLDGGPHAWPNRPDLSASDLIGQLATSQ